jgi:hypothetical protein
MAIWYHGVRMNYYSGRTTRNTGVHLLRLPTVVGDILEAVIGPSVVPKKAQPNFGILFSADGLTPLHHVRLVPFHLGIHSHIPQLILTHQQLHIRYNLAMAFKLKTSRTSHPIALPFIVTRALYSIHALC